ncbi:RagB/SusD family nutrient uptake outer membrane protein [Belliella kenyensis]|uniref:RagB/SusD family nutrient uptake outer membrane protein n=1 Tax=Belliella kenyensis TaxID=1472724 RepID=A0ABV8ENI8_9BACT|nr:RagB/SusD family nutrient uptake outer membrane protein [Belliella kenyensis]MCH7401651.1 RagB/SusD family nutrient uptake outer membrane protein [Belliella kenyensis]MDN3603071.1 RagB/SusD family nutrient uptake outer membrane protein [Belliella kenyensis]
MKKYNRIYLLTFLLTGWLVSCNDDFLDTSPLGEVAESAVWSDAGLAEAFVTDIYGGLVWGGFNEQALASLTDEAIFTHPGRGITVVTEARSNPENPGWIDDSRAWSNMYARLRSTNIAIEKLSDPQFENTGGIVDRLLGEATFMRAYFSHQLLRNYAAFPIADRTYKLGEETYEIPRNTFEECVNFIIADLDKAAQLLDGHNLIRGRANRVAALALKARVLLYAASDLHDIPTASANSPIISSYSNKELLGYISGNRIERWQRAKDAAKAAMDLMPGNQLQLTTPLSAEQAATVYNNNSLSRNGGENEMIFGRYYLNSKPEWGGRQGLFNGPNGYNNWAGNTPVQLMIDDYEMMDGSDFDWSNPEHASAPYDNRDPRFYATFLYDGAQWKPRSPANQSRDPLGQIQTGSYEVTNASGAKVTHWGLDTRSSPIEDWNGSYTGYYVRKFIEPDPAHVDQNTWQEIPWPAIRVTEVVMNYIEACIELGQEDEARAWLNKIRFRAGMPATTASGQELREKYINERRVELAFEEQRYYDTRRWMIAPQTLGRQANGIQIRGTLKPGQSNTLYRYDPEIYDYNYQVFDIDPGKENRLWLDKMYWMPIHFDEMNRNSELIQNPGY